jgi:hypothetical protein
MAVRRMIFNLKMVLRSGACRSGQVEDNRGIGADPPAGLDTWDMGFPISFPGFHEMDSDVCHNI